MHNHKIFFKNVFSKVRKKPHGGAQNVTGWSATLRFFYAFPYLWEKLFLMVEPLRCGYPPSSPSANTFFTLKI